MELFNNFSDYPPILQAADIKNILGISKGKTYELLKSYDFPTVFIGDKRMIVLKDEFISWLKDDKRKIKRIPILTISKSK